MRRPDDSNIQPAKISSSSIGVRDLYLISNFACSQFQFDLMIGLPQVIHQTGLLYNLRAPPSGGPSYRSDRVT